MPTMEPANDMKAAERMYDSFIATLKWTVPLLAIVAMLVVIIIS
jgi:hypothetical protein